MSRIINVLLSILLVVTCIDVYADNNRRSDSKKPDWLTGKMPQPGNSSFSYQITEYQNMDLNTARKGCLINLTEYLKQTNSITVKGEVKAMSRTSGTKRQEKIDTEYAYVYKIDGETFHILFRKVDEYWEIIKNISGEKTYRCICLYAVANSSRNAVFDEISFSYKYGAAGLWRSALVPGWGQMYKGSTGKGLGILVGETLMIGGIILCENRRADYTAKINETHDINKKRSYSDLSNNYEIGRNVCIGAAAALYIYNIIDAVAVGGRKRTIIRKSKGMSFKPVQEREYNGFALTYNF